MTSGTQFFQGTNRVIRTAKKQHKCAYNDHMIDPGDRYIEETVPPWTLLIDDPEGPYSPIGHWEHIRYHITCDPHDWWA